VAQKLMDTGYTKVYALKGGWREWVNAGYPTEKK
jgi:rhodanese-related sulfurtransferase